jgi:hypothetical protein
LTEIFGPDVEKVRINRDYKKLQHLVDERNQVALLLEGAENKFINEVNRIAIKKGRKDVPAIYGRNTSTLYIEDKNRPRHKVGMPVIKLLFGKKAQAIENSSDGRLTQLNGHEPSSRGSIPKFLKSRIIIQITTRLIRRL